jgi:hypothetical protein
MARVANRANAYDRSPGLRVMGLDDRWWQNYSSAILVNVVGHRYQPDLQRLLASSVVNAESLDRSQVFFPGGARREQHKHQPNAPLPLHTEQLVDPLNRSISGSHKQTTDQVRVGEEAPRRRTFFIEGLTFMDARIGPNERGVYLQRTPLFPRVMARVIAVHVIVLVGWQQRGAACDRSS